MAVRRWHRDIGLALALAMSAAPQAMAADGPTKIGMSLPLGAGNADYYQKEIVAPAEFAIEEANAAGGVLGRKIGYVIEDNKADAASGASVARKLIDIDGVQMIFAVITPAVLATLPFAEDNRILVMTLSEHPQVTASGWGARCALPGTRYGAVSAEYAYKTLGARTAGILGEDNDGIRALDDAFRKDFTGMGGKVLAVEGFKPGDQDLRAQLTHIKAANPDLLLIESADARPYGLALKQAAELDFHPRFKLGRDEATVPEVRQIAGALLSGFYAVGVKMDPGWNDKVFKPHFGYDADSQAARTYDCMRIYLLAVQRAGTNDPGKVRDALFHISDYVGAVGAWGYHGTGEPDMKLIVNQIK